MNALKNYWKNLNAREKMFLMVGGGLIIILIAYLMIWQPLANQVQWLRQNLTEQRTLLNWLQQTASQIEKLRHSGQVKQSLPLENFSKILKTEMANDQLTSFISDFKIDNNAAEITFAKVSFDQLMMSLIHLTQAYPLQVKKISITPSVSPGLVSVSLVIAIES